MIQEMMQNFGGQPQDVLTTWDGNEKLILAWNTRKSLPSSSAHFTIACH
jgi:hypothetical protein